jgi:hypothetical protein
MDFDDFQVEIQNMLSENWKTAQLSQEMLTNPIGYIFMEPYRIAAVMLRLLLSFHEVVVVILLMNMLVSFFHYAATSNEVLVTMLISFALMIWICFLIVYTGVELKADELILRAR